MKPIFGCHGARYGHEKNDVVKFDRNIADARKVTGDIDIDMNRIDRNCALLLKF